MSESKAVDPANRSIQEVAEHFGVTERTVRRWIATTDIPHRRIERTIRFNLAEVDTWSRSRADGDAA